ncbi:karyopherin beta [Thoreauomyces humboldtii]|nr:karyopherin beta [Thoreauomyces humboldtii]
MLCQELTNEQNSEFVRQSAGLLLKNVIIAKESPKKDELAARWLQLDAQTRSAVKQAALQTLGTSARGASNGATQIIQAIAEVELPHNEWPELIPGMLENVTGLTKADNEDLRRATLQALGLVCEAVDPNVLVQYSNPILTAVVSGARKEEPSAKVQESALKALYNALEFVKSNFEEANERNYIMTVLCHATRHEVLAVQVAAFECLVKIAFLYYRFMNEYMETALGGITIWGMKHKEEAIALQAVEFWSTICEVEADILAEGEVEEGELDEPPRKNFGFGFAAVLELSEALWWLMTKKEEDDDEDDWNISMAASTCLALLASCSQDAVVQPVLTFVQTHIQSTDWRYREASVMAFGAILDGPNPEVLGPVVSQALPVLLGLMKDPSVLVKDTTAWTLGRVCELLPNFIPMECLQLFMSSLLEGLQEHHRVAANCAWSIMNIGENLGVAHGDADTYILSQFFDTMVQATNAAADRSSDPNFKASCYEAMSSLVQNCARDCLDTVNKLAILVLERLEHTSSMQNQLLTADDKRNHYELQSNLCGLLAACIRRLHSQVVPIADRSMAAVLTVMSGASKTSTVLEDAFLTIGGLTTALEGDFARYMGAFAPELFTALQNVEEYQMCSIAVGLVGDISRALGEQMLPYCDQLMNVLMQDLQNPALNKMVKPSILSTFGDIAVAIGGNFSAYVEVTMLILSQASVMATNTMANQYDFDYGNQLRESIIEAYVGITQGLHGAGKDDLLSSATPQVFAFAQEVAQSDKPRTPEVTNGLVGLIGDLADAIPVGPYRALFSEEWVGSLFRSIKKDKNMDVEAKKTAKWARDMVKRQIGA